MSRAHVYVRPLRPTDDDVAAFRAAMEAKPVRHYPKDVFGLPGTRVMVAERRETYGVEILGYQPHYVSLAMGSWVPVDGASDIEVAASLHALTAAAYTRANTEGMAEILIHSNTPATIAYALRHNYQKTHDTLRLEVR